ncbi:hypothetical protein L195_g046816 [Trifolium pratense]|uniref:Uncharacterized protein n=1 Tax=Trifolium pratense TaxID=57577 RepID=A0A2K3MIT6_TRIPR|nr:hypothetical protein L195_g046816 [Trifolium pratense]
MPSLLGLASLSLRKFQSTYNRLPTPMNILEDCVPFNTLSCAPNAALYRVLVVTVCLEYRRPTSPHLQIDPLFGSCNALKPLEVNPIAAPTPDVHNRGDSDDEHDQRERISSAHSYPHITPSHDRGTEFQGSLEYELNNIRREVAFFQEDQQARNEREARQEERLNRMGSRQHNMMSSH